MELIGELRLKGVGKAEVAEATSEGAFNEEAACVALAVKKKSLTDDKLMQYLARKGFPYKSIRAAVAARRQRVIADRFAAASDYSGGYGGDAADAGAVSSLSDDVVALTMPSPVERGDSDDEGASDADDDEDIVDTGAAPARPPATESTRGVTKASMGGNAIAGRATSAAVAAAAQAASSLPTATAPRVSGSSNSAAGVATAVSTGPSGGSTAATNRTAATGDLRSTGTSSGVHSSSADVGSTISSSSSKRGSSGSRSGSGSGSGTRTPKQAATEGEGASNTGTGTGSRKRKAATATASGPSPGSAAPT